MILQLTGPQWNAVSHRIPNEWKETMREHRTATYGRSHNYDLPASCWRILLDRLRLGAIGPLGGFTQGPDALYSAISLITRRVHEIEQHPALSPGLHVTGWMTGVIPAWDTRPGRSCYPADAPFIVLQPRHLTERGWKLTTWISAGDQDLVIAKSLADCEDVELRLHRQFSVVDAEL